MDCTLICVYILYVQQQQYTPVFQQEVKYSNSRENVNLKSYFTRWKSLKFKYYILFYKYLQS